MVWQTYYTHFMTARRRPKQVSNFLQAACAWGVAGFCSRRGNSQVSSVFLVAQMGRRRKFLQWMQNYEDVLDWELTQSLLQDPDTWFCLGWVLVACKEERTNKQDSLWGFSQVWQKGWEQRGLMGRLKQSWRVRVDRSRAMETLADGEKPSLPHSIHVSCRQEPGCFQPSNAFPQLLAGTGRSCWPTLRRAAKHQRHQHLALPHMASGEETSISATQGIPTGSLGLSPPIFLWIHLISTHNGRKKKKGTK